MTKLKDKEEQVLELEQELEMKDGEIARLKRNKNNKQEGPSKRLLCTCFIIIFLVCLIIVAVVLIYAASKTSRYHFFEPLGLIEEPDDEEPPM